MNIIFGSKKLGIVDGAIAGSYSKYPNQAVVTIEGDRGSGMGRRILFNKLAAEKFDLKAGEIQHILFGTIQAGENTPSRVLISNQEEIVNSDDLKSYRTSKNFIAFDKDSGQDTAERGKSISSSVITKEILSFLGDDENTTREFSINTFDMDGTSVYELVERVESATNETVDLKRVESIENHTPFAEAREESVDSFDLVAANENDVITEDNNGAA